MPGRILFTSVLTSFILLLSTHAFSQPWQLRYQMPAGTWKFKRVENTKVLAQSNDGRSTTIERITTRYYTVDVEESSDGNIHYILKQDTALVEDGPGLASTDQTSIAFQNLLTRKRIRAVITPVGTPVHVEALDPLDIATLLGPNVSERAVLQEAFIFPTLPEKTLEAGMSWTDESKDTLYPNRELPGYGRGEGLRLQDVSTKFTVGSFDNTSAPPCLMLSWKSHMTLEEQTLYSKLEDYLETRTDIDAEMCFDPLNGRLVKITVNTMRESTRALFGESSNVVPSSTSTILTLSSLPL